MSAIVWPLSYPTAVIAKPGGLRSHIAYKRPLALERVQLPYQSRRLFLWERSLRYHSPISREATENLMA